MDAALDVLSVIGIAAVAWRLARSFLRLLGRGAESVWAEEMANVRSRRGDLTGMAEADEQARSVARSRRRAAAATGFWVFLLAAPAVTPWARPVYAGLSLLWLLPAPSVRSDRV